MKCYGNVLGKQICFQLEDCLMLEIVKLFLSNRTFYNDGNIL